jgi:peptidoglycan DL-endopeptidase CwlO
MTRCNRVTDLSRSTGRSRIRRTLLAAGLAACLGVCGLTASSAAPSRSDLEEAEERLLELEREFELVVEKYNLVRERLADIQRRIGRLRLDVEAIERRMGSKEEAAVEVAVELYKSGATGTLEAVLSSDSLAEMESRLTYLSSSEKAQAKIFESLAADRTELEGKIAELEEAETEAVAAKNQLADLRTEIEAKVADQEDEIAELTEAIERAQAREQAREEAARRAALEAAAAASPDPAPAAAAATPTAHASNPSAQVAVDAALSQVGKPYQWGAAGPDAYDCSGLTMWAWAQAGVSLPHNSSMQYAATARVSQSDAQPGDLLFFGSPIHHVGMYVGGGQMVEAPYSGQSVRVVSSARSDFVGAGRPGV